MAKDIEEKIGAMSQKNCHGLKYKYPLKNYRVHEMPTGDQLPPHYLSDIRLIWHFEIDKVKYFVMLHRRWVFAVR